MVDIPGKDKGQHVTGVLKNKAALFLL